jgi:adenine-specific DNA-methyltransferase
MSHELPGPPGYCSSQLIPYLGNKRSLLPRLYPVLLRLDKASAQHRFVDVFAGTGAVSRLARAMGMQVFSNDWEPYSKAINSCWLGLHPDDVDVAFGGWAGLDAVLQNWNAMHPQAPSPTVPESAVAEPYMARWYAPASTVEPLLGSERLFYTAENAIFMDRVRTRIENEFLGCEPGSIAWIRQNVLMGALLLEAAVHANTSGVFKAYHKGFGGNGKDALSRIMGRMVLEAPILPAAERASVSCLDAAAFIKNTSADIAYFDPPYNQHQYGSNYHILNTILRWDRRPLPMDSALQSGFSVKAGIPESWKATRSDFCVKGKARSAIEAVLASCDAATLVFSWSADGHLHAEELVDILAQRGAVDIVALDYVAYRGGRQSASRSSSSQEYLFVVDAGSKPMLGNSVMLHLRDLVASDQALRSTYDPVKVRAIFGILPNASNKPELFGSTRASMPASKFFDEDLRRPAPNAGELLKNLDNNDRKSFMDLLASCACSDILDELRVLLTMARESARRGNTGKALKIISKAPRLMRKLAHDKSSVQFNRFMDELYKIEGLSQNRRLMNRLDSLEKLMAMRRCS